MKVGDLVIEAYDPDIPWQQQERALGLVLENVTETPENLYEDADAMIKVLWVTGCVAGESSVEWKHMFEVWSEAETQSR